ncbi:hypothetical protein HLBENOHH_01966 [Aeromonas dhakensis]
MLYFLFPIRNKFTASFGICRILYFLTNRNFNYNATSVLNIK